MKAPKQRTLLLATSLLGAMTFAAPAMAQSEPQAAEQDGRNLGVQEIVVTAQRRADTLLNVPLSIQAATGEQLQTSGIKQLTDLQFTTPGYNVSDSNGYTQIFIRGIGNAIFVGADPSVATFIDDVPRIYGSMVNNFVNVERVEVLKGAQGGLYGRNATGGVVNIITKQPSLDGVKGDMRLTYGTEGTFQAAAFVNLPITDTVAIALSGQRRYHKPYIENIAPENPYTAAMFPSGAFLPTGPSGAFAANTPAQTAAFFNSGVDRSDVADEDFWAFDGKLLLQPSDDVKIVLAADYSHKDDSNGNATWNQSPAYMQGVLAATFQSVGITTNFPAGFVLGNPPKFKVQSAGPGFVFLEDYGFSGTVTFSLPTFDLTSITAYRQQETDFTLDLGANSVPLTAALVNNHKHYFYQELRAVSTFEGPLALIGGATYLKNKFKGATDVSLLAPFTSFAVARATDKVTNWSVYGQASYEFTDELTGTVSGRYIHEKNDAFFTLSSTPFGSKEKKFLPSATISYKLGRGNIYARWARGFKSGGINVVADVNAFQGSVRSGSVFDGETVDTYEAGLKTTFLDNRVQFTGSVFYNDYKDLQTAAHANAQFANTVILAIINAGTARTWGVEGSLQARVAEPLTVGVNAGYLNAKYKTFRNTDPTVLDLFDLSGTRMINSPKFQASFTGNLDQPITEQFNLTGSLLVQRTSSVLWQVSGFPGVLPDSVGKGYWLTNARIGIRTSDKKYELALFANNLFNNAYTTYGNSNIGNSTQYAWGNPRILGVELSAKF